MNNSCLVIMPGPTLGMGIYDEYESFAAFIKIIIRKVKHKIVRGKVR